MYIVLVFCYEDSSPLQYLYEILLNSSIKDSLKMLLVAGKSDEYNLQELFNMLLSFVDCSYNCSSISAILSTVIGVHFGHVLIHMKVISKNIF